MPLCKIYRQIFGGYDFTSRGHTCAAVSYGYSTIKFRSSLLLLPQEGVVKGVIPSPFEGEGYDSREGGGRAKQEARAEDEGD